LQRVSKRHVGWNLRVFSPYIFWLLLVFWINIVIVKGVFVLVGYSLGCLIGVLLLDSSEEGESRGTTKRGKQTDAEKGGSMRHVRACVHICLQCSYLEFRNIWEFRQGVVMCISGIQGFPHGKLFLGRKSESLCT